MTRTPRLRTLLALLLLGIAAAIGVFGIGRGLAMVTIAALFGGPFAQIYLGGTITAAGAAWLGCVGILGVKALRASDGQAPPA